jgi:hypothetical protein
MNELETAEVKRNATGPKARNDARLQLVCPSWLKQELERDADRLERPLSDLIRERLAAPYRERREA